MIGLGILTIALSAVVGFLMMLIDRLKDEVDKYEKDFRDVVETLLEVEAELDDAIISLAHEVEGNKELTDTIEKYVIYRDAIFKNTDK